MNEYVLKSNDSFLRLLSSATILGIGLYVHSNDISIPFYLLALVILIIPGREYIIDEESLRLRFVILFGLIPFEQKYIRLTDITKIIRPKKRSINDIDTRKINLSALPNNVIHVDIDVLVIIQDSRTVRIPRISNEEDFERFIKRLESVISNFDKDVTFTKNR